MIPQDVPPEWSKEALLSKAQSYAEVMLSFPHDDWKFALWSTLSLELLARAALSAFSPVLVADAQNWHNLLHALDIKPKASKFNPRAIDISKVCERLQDLLLDFTPELQNFCIGHMARRNEELHSGATPFVSASNIAWLPTYYRACEVLLASMGHTLDLFLGDPEATFASGMIIADNDQSAKAVAGKIRSFAEVWANESTAEKDVLALQASTWATKQTGHRVLCPACKCNAVVSGSAISAPVLSITSDEITETIEYLPSIFECVACNLKISGLSQLIVAGVGSPYNATLTYDVRDYYALVDDYQGYEPDYNEP